MEKEFIPYQEALELKQLGFDEPCFGWFASDRTLVKEVTEKTDFTLAPTYSQAFRWFREKNDLFGQVNIRTYFIYDISNDDSKMVKKYDKLLTTYEEAELECLKQLIKIVKEQQK
jgi:hypothetical protein